MERNWYVICTKQLQEKKVTEFLTKKGIENYCPFTLFKKKNGTQTITAHLPLFRSYVFVCTTRDEIQSIKALPNIVNTVYWKSEPVILKEAEITAIKLMADNYINIKLEKTPVSTNDDVGIIEENITAYKNNFVTIKPQALDITLPSLGYRMIAQRKNVNKASPQKKPSLVSSFAKRLNPAFLFGF